MKKMLFDTSVLVAGMVAAHPKHHSAFKWLQRARAKEISVFISAHSLAETYAVLTRLPLSPRITSDIARYLLRENVENMAKVVSLTAQDYQKVLKNVTELGLSGGIIYDAITLYAAEKSKVDQLLTLNVRDFERLKPKKNDFVLRP